MERRTFISRVLQASIAAGVASNWPQTVFAQSCPLVEMPRTLVNVMLLGGADMRFVFMPAPNHPDGLYLDNIWNARRALYSGDYASYEQMFENEYLLTTDARGGPAFGIHNSSGWLQSEFEAGRAAVVANAFCSRNRRHDQSVLNADAGEPDLAQLVVDRAGWGGRLVEQIDSSPNVVELGPSVSVFSKGSDPNARMAQVVHAANMRNMALSGTSPEVAVGARRNIVARALHSWYAARGPELRTEQAANWPYHTFIDHHGALQEFGLAVEERLARCLPIPDELNGLTLNHEMFAQQCRNLFDACQLPDVLGSRVLSMSYGGWDTHDNEAEEITGNLSDLFGFEGGFANALPALDAIPTVAATAREQLVFCFASDFGRQLIANGTQGTDHGRGTYSILLGSAIGGGVYGEMFPQAEARPGTDGRIALQTQGADIAGQTSTEKVLAAACDWAEPGTAAAVFPNAVNARIETPGLLDGLFS